MTARAQLHTRWFWASLALSAMAAMAAGGCAHQEHAHWDYGSSGPAAWGMLSPEYAACKDGHLQSPIDLSPAAPARGQPLKLDYHPSSIRLLNNGHTVQFDYDPGSTLTLDGTDYRLLQFHFHSPGEHVSGDRSYPLEMHLVHQAADGRRAVVAVWFDVGAANDALEPGWAALPHDAGERRTVPGAVDASKLLPASNAYYRYAGSLTAPPCSEGISWIVMRAPLELSPAQLKAFTTLYRNSARPLQPLNERGIDLITPP